MKAPYLSSVYTQEQAAMDRYNSRYNNQLYLKATNGKSVRYANKLIDHALAICGHPFYKLSYYNWSAAAIEFLRQF